MEEPIQAKRRIHELPVIGGGGIEGLVVWGGALVTIRKGRKVDDMKEMEDNVEGKGMQFFIPVNENPSEIFYETSEIDSSELVPIKNLISEENAVHTIIDVDEEKKDSEVGHQENSLSDTEEQESIAITDDSERDHQEILLSDTEAESNAFSDDYSVVEEFLLPSTHSFPWNNSESISNSDDEEKSFSTSTESSLSTVSSTDDEEEHSSIQSLTSVMLSMAQEFPLPSTDSDEEKSILTPTGSSLSTASSTYDEEEYSSIQSSTSSMLSAAEEFPLPMLEYQTFILEYQHLC